MGTNSSALSDSTVSLSSLLKRYQVVDKNQDNLFTIVKEKDSQTLFIIREIVFVDKTVYERHLCRFNHFQQREQSQNILNLHKLWTEEHNTFCSNTYKIFAMYEFSNVTLLDQMQARRTQSKHFQEDELLGMIQSCVNALNFQSPILVSPCQYYITQDGLLKLNNVDLFDSNVLETFTKNVYYSPEKMQNFDSLSFYNHSENYLKQAIFSLGITLLSAVYLEDLTDRIYSPLQPNKKMRFNYTLMKTLLQKINSRNLNPLSDRLLSLIMKMLEYHPKNRPTLSYIQQELQQITKQRVTQIQIEEEQDNEQFDPQTKMSNVQIPKKYEKDEKQNKFAVFKAQNLSTIYDKNIQNPSTFRNQIVSQNSQLQILRQLSIANCQQYKNVVIHKPQKINYHPQLQVPLILSAVVEQPIVKSEDHQEINGDSKELPQPISSENPLFTNPQFLAKINQDIKKFTLERKNSFASTQISRQNSHLIIFAENLHNHQKRQRQLFNE